MTPVDPNALTLFITLGAALVSAAAAGIGSLLTPRGRGVAAGLRAGESDAGRFQRFATEARDLARMWRDLEQVDLADSCDALGVRYQAVCEMYQAVAEVERAEEADAGAVVGARAADLELGRDLFTALPDRSWADDATMHAAMPKTGMRCACAPCVDERRERERAKRQQPRKQSPVRLIFGRAGEPVCPACQDPLQSYRWAERSDCTTFHPCGCTRDGKWSWGGQRVATPPPVAQGAPASSEEHWLVGPALEALRQHLNAHPPAHPTTGAGPDLIEVSAFGRRRRYLHQPEPEEDDAPAPSWWLPDPDAPARQGRLDLAASNTLHADLLRAEEAAGVGLGGRCPGCDAEVTRMALLAETGQARLGCGCNFKDGAPLRVSWAM